MDKHSDFIPSAGKGLLAGAGVSAALVMARDFVQALEDSKAEKRRRNPHTDSNTIVINIPDKDGSEKLSSARDSFAGASSPNSKTVPLDRPQRDGHGRFTPKWVAKANFGKKAQANGGGSALGWGLGGGAATLAPFIPYMEKFRQKLVEYPGKVKEHAGDITGAALGSIGGYIIVKKIHDMLEKKRLEREIAEAQKEYVDLLQKKSEYDILEGIDGKDGVVKAAEGYDPSSRPSDFGSAVSDWVSSIITPGKTPKAVTPVGKALEAGGKAMDEPVAKLTEESTWVGGGALATAALLSLTTAYVTKKILDKKFKDQRQQAKFTPRQTRIMFKTSADHSAEIEPETAIAALSFIKQAWSFKPFNSFAGRFGGKVHDPLLRGVDYLADRGAHFAANQGKKLLTPKNTDDLTPYVDFLSNKDNFRNVLNYKNDGTLDKMWGAKNARTLLGLDAIKNDDAKMKTLMGAAIKKNPELVQVMNDPKYNKMMQGYADSALNDYFNNSGFGKAMQSGWLGRSGLGESISNLLKRISSWFMGNTAMGRKFRQNQMLSYLGVKPEDIQPPGTTPPGGTTPPAGTTTPPATTTTTTTPVAGATDPLPAGDAVTPPPPSGQVATDAPQSGEPVMEKPGSAEKDAQGTMLAMKAINAVMDDGQPKSNLDPELQDLVKRLAQKEVGDKPAVEVTVTGDDKAARAFARRKRKELMDIVQSLNAVDPDKQ